MYRTLRKYSFADKAEDIRGATLYGTDDEKLGKIDDVVFEQSSGRIEHLIIDTGGWLRSRKFLVPADQLMAHDREEGGFRVNLTKLQIESFPTFNEDVLSSEARYSEYATQYRAAWPESETIASRPQRLSSFEERLQRDRENILRHGRETQATRPSRERKAG